jgi:hypothetical protein
LNKTIKKLKENLDSNCVHLKCELLTQASTSYRDCVLFPVICMYTNLQWKMIHAVFLILLLLLYTFVSKITFRLQLLEKRKEVQFCVCVPVVEEVR